MLQVSDLHVAYGESEVLHGLDFTVAPNEIIAIMGRNGMGKTTLMKSLIGVVPTKSGSVKIGDTEISGMKSFERVASGVAYVPQGREIFPLLTVAENLETGYAAVPRAMRHVPDDIYQLFPVLRDMLGRRGGDLSGGQQQQLAIARALVTRPRLLLLDEPTEGIQPSIIKDIERIIRHLADQGEMAIVLVEQYFEFARDLADAFVVMDRGEVVLSGKKEDMVETDVRRYLTV